MPQERHFPTGSKVLALASEKSPSLLPATVEAAHPDGTCTIKFDQTGTRRENICPLQMFSNPNKEHHQAGDRIIGVWKTEGPTAWVTFTGKVAAVQTGPLYTVSWDDGDVSTLNGDYLWSDEAPGSLEIEPTQRVLARFRNSPNVQATGARSFYRGVAVRQNDDGTWHLSFEDGDEDSAVPLASIFPLHLAEPFTEAAPSMFDPLFGIHVDSSGHLRPLDHRCGGLRTTAQFVGEMLHLGLTRGVATIENMAFSYNLDRFESPPDSDDKDDQRPVITADFTPRSLRLFHCGRVVRAADDSLKEQLSCLGTASQAESIAAQVFKLRIDDDATSGAPPSDSPTIRRIRAVTGNVMIEESLDTDRGYTCGVKQAVVTLEYQKNDKNSNAVLPLSNFENAIKRSYEIEFPELMEYQQHGTLGQLRQVIVAQQLALAILKCDRLSRDALTRFLTAFDIHIPSEDDIKACEEDQVKEEITLHPALLPLEIHTAGSTSEGIACSVVYQGACRPHLALVKILKDAHSGKHKSFGYQMAWDSTTAPPGMTHFGTLEIPVSGMAGGIILSGQATSTRSSNERAELLRSFSRQGASVRACAPTTMCGGTRVHRYKRSQGTFQTPVGTYEAHSGLPGAWWSEAARNVGPTPEGQYQVVNPRDDEEGWRKADLKPINHNAQGRTHLQIHYPSKNNLKRLAKLDSRGCIVTPGAKDVDDGDILVVEK